MTVFILIVCASIIVTGLWWLCHTPVGFIGLKPALLAKLSKLGARPFDPLERDSADKFTGKMLGQGKLASGVLKTQLRIDLGDMHVPCVLYKPAAKGPLPVLVWIHGGCWLLGRPDHGEREISFIAKEANVLVVSVDYRLAPEHPFPAGLNDCFSVTQWLSQNANTLGGDCSKISVGGSSAGGNLAAAVALRATEDGIKLRSQILRVPITDAVKTIEWPSYRQAGEDFLLGTRTMLEAIDLYTPDAEQRHHPWVSPLRAKNLSGLPPTLITTAELDPLRDQAEAYAAALIEQQVSVTLKRFPRTIHDFIATPKALRESSQMAVALLNSVNSPAIHDPSASNQNKS